MNSTPVANRVHISIFGRRNAGKSTLINAITNQNIAVVSDVPGTTTDPVYKTMELLPIGPVVIIDTAGIDDVGELGNLRVEKTYDILRKTNIAIIVLSVTEEITDAEIEFIEDIKKRGIQLLGVVNKCDLISMDSKILENYSETLKIPVMAISSKSNIGIEELKNEIANKSNKEDKNTSLVENLVKPHDVVVLVTPIDKGAPKGRLILPQQQTIRDILESDAVTIVTKETELKETLKSLAKKPSLLITDSQAFSKVSKETPEDIPMTSFSILFARYKGELNEMVKGIEKIKKLQTGDKILIVEGCTHHRQEEDIGKVKIPKWIKEKLNVDPQFEWVSGTSFPKDITIYKAIIHCGGCMLNKQEMKYRLNKAIEEGVAITNYGILIAYVEGILERALKPFNKI